MPFDKLGNAFVLIRAGGRMKPLSRYAEVCERRKQAREDYRQDSRRHHEDQAVRYRDQPAFQQNVCLALSVIGADQLVLESEFTTKIRSLALLREGRGRTGFDDASIDARGRKRSGQVRAGLV